jgi:hypothetical protein
MDTNCKMDIKNEVAKAAKWFDENHPGWYNKINLDTLDMAWCFDCVIGQVFPPTDYRYSYNYMNHFNRISPIFDKLGISSVVFMDSDNQRDCWVNEILNRRAASLQPTELEEECLTA